MKAFPICANFSGRNIADSATLHSGYKLTGAQSAPSVVRTCSPLIAA
jgi:hypothetical protein